MLRLQEEFGLGHSPISMLIEFNSTLFSGQKQFIAIPFSQPTSTLGFFPLKFSTIATIIPTPLVLAIVRVLVGSGAPQQF